MTEPKISKVDILRSRHGKREPPPPKPRPPQSSESRAVADLWDRRGRTFTLAFFGGIPEADLIAVYRDLPIDDDTMKRIKTILKERLE